MLCESKQKFCTSTFIFSRMLVESYMVIVVYLVIYLVESYHRLYFSVIKNYAYYEFIVIFIIELYLKRL